MSIRHSHWTEADIAQLTRWYQSGVTARGIAQRLGRSQMAVESALRRCRAWRKPRETGHGTTLSDEDHARWMAYWRLPRAARQAIVEGT